MGNSKAISILLCVMIAIYNNSFASVPGCQMFNEYEDARCEDEMSHLDNYGLQLNRESGSQGYIIFYEGKYWEGRNPRRHEAEARAARIKDYLVKVRKVSSERLTIIDGGYRKNFTIQLYICPSGDGAPAATPTLKLKDIRFRKGNIKKEAYVWYCF